MRIGHRARVLIGVVNVGNWDKLIVTQGSDARGSCAHDRQHSEDTQIPFDGYLPNGEPPKAGEIFKSPDIARTLKKLVEAETANKTRGRHSAARLGVALR